MIETMEAIKKLGFATIVIYPNSDAGSRNIIEVIERYKQLSFINVYKSLDHITYLSLISHSHVMVGNSSSGIIESPTFNIPVVNIGKRQNGRERAKNILDVMELVSVILDN